MAVSRQRKQHRSPYHAEVIEMNAAYQELIGKFRARWSGRSQRSADRPKETLPVQLPISMHPIEPAAD
jgi:hypothetical protein